MVGSDLSRDALSRMVTGLTNNLSKAIKFVDLNKVRDNKSGRIQDSPWVKIPNVKSFSVNLGNWDFLFALFGIKKRLPATLEIVRYINKPMNRYAEHQIIRLNKARGNPRLYWLMAKILMKRSNVFRVMAINHVFTTWYRNYPLGFILNVNRKVSKLVNKGLSTLEYSRKYIPKGEDDFRPLGIPTPEWRLLLHMHSNFLIYFIKDLECQHGFLPSKGTLTAWKDIFLKKLLDKPYIKEYDFKSFFDKVHSNRITEILLNMGVPKEEVYFLENINRSEVKLPSEEKLDERAAKEKAGSHHDIREGIINATRDMYQPVREFLAAQPGIDGYDLLNLFMMEDDCGSIQEFLQLQWAMFDSFKPAKIASQFEGVAQGANTSPILANLIMDIWVKHCKNEGHEIVAYADDSVVFSDHPIRTKAPADTGIVIHKDKTGYVKHAGNWVKPLKFLGLEFDGKQFSAHTRKGSRLVLEDRMKLLLELFNELHNRTGILNPDELLEYINSKITTVGVSEKLQIKGTWEDYFKSRLIGFIQSRLYHGSWNLDNLEQDFNLKFVDGSWMSTRLSDKVSSIFDASSYASTSLLNILRYNQKLRKPKRPRIRLVPY